MIGKPHTTACIRNSGFSGKLKVSAFNKSLYQTESEVLLNPLLLIHANRCGALKETEIENWKEYIDQKFQPVGDFEIKGQQDSPTMDIKHIRTGTIVSFIWPDDEWKKVSDIQYWNKQTEGWSGEFGDVEFNEENKKAVDKFLDSVFETGWSSKDIYLFGKHYKSIVFDRPNLKGHKFTYWSSNYGCIALILFPIFLIIGFLIRLRVLGRIEHIEIEPIKKNNDTTTSAIANAG